MGFADNIGRRQFLKISSTAVIATALSGILSRNKMLAAEPKLNSLSDLVKVRVAAQKYLFTDTAEETKGSAGKNEVQPIDLVPKNLNDTIIKSAGSESATRKVIELSYLSLFMDQFKESKRDKSEETEKSYQSYIEFKQAIEQNPELYGPRLRAKLLRAIDGLQEDRQRDLFETNYDTSMVYQGIGNIIDPLETDKTQRSLVNLLIPKIVEDGYQVNTWNLEKANVAIAEGLTEEIYRLYTTDPQFKALVDNPLFKNNLNLDFAEGTRQLEGLPKDLKEKTERFIAAKEHGQEITAAQEEEFAREVIQRILEKSTNYLDKLKAEQNTDLKLEERNQLTTERALEANEITSAVYLASSLVGIVFKDPKTAKAINVTYENVGKLVGLNEEIMAGEAGTFTAIGTWVSVATSLTDLFSTSPSFEEEVMTALKQIADSINILNKKVDYLVEGQQKILEGIQHLGDLINTRSAEIHTQISELSKQLNSDEVYERVKDRKIGEQIFTMATREIRTEVANKVEHLNYDPNKVQESLNNLASYIMDVSSMDVFNASDLANWDALNVRDLVNMKLERIDLGVGLVPIIYKRITNEDLDHSKFRNPLLMSQGLLNYASTVITLPEIFNGSLRNDAADFNQVASDAKDGFSKVLNSEFLNKLIEEYTQAFEKVLDMAITAAQADIQVAIKMPPYLNPPSDMSGPIVFPFQSPLLPKDGFNLDKHVMPRDQGKNLIASLKQRDGSSGYIDGRREDRDNYQVVETVVASKDDIFRIAERNRVISLEVADGWLPRAGIYSINFNSGPLEGSTNFVLNRNGVVDQVGGGLYCVWWHGPGAPAHYLGEEVFGYKDVQIHDLFEFLQVVTKSVMDRHEELKTAFKTKFVTTVQATIEGQENYSAVKELEALASSITYLIGLNFWFKDGNIDQATEISKMAASILGTRENIIGEFNSIMDPKNAPKDSDGKPVALNEAIEVYSRRVMLERFTARLTAFINAVYTKKELEDGVEQLSQNKDTHCKDGDLSKVYTSKGEDPKNRVWNTPTLPKGRTLGSLELAIYTTDTALQSEKTKPQMQQAR